MKITPPEKLKGYSKNRDVYSSEYTQQQQVNKSIHNHQQKLSISIKSYTALYTIENNLKRIYNEINRKSN